MIQSFRDLEVWQKSMDLTVRIYKATETLPPAEDVRPDVANAVSVDIDSIEHC